MTNQHQSFITEYLRHRSPFTAYCLAYNLKDCSNYESIMSSANRLMNNEEVGGTIRSILDNIRHEVEQEVRAEMKTELLIVQRKRELLASIATGEMVAIQNYKGKDCNVCTQMVRPTINQMLRAIDLDNKMVGLYPVYNRQSTIEKVPKSEHTSRNGREFTTKNKNSPPYEGGVDCNPRQPDYNRGEVDSRRTDNTEKTTQIGNISQQSEIENTQTGNNGEALNETNKNHHERINSQPEKKDLSPARLSPAGGGVSLLTGVGHSRETDNSEKTTQIGNISQQKEIEISQNHNISQQSALMDNKIEPLSIEPLRNYM